MQLFTVDILLLNRGKILLQLRDNKPNIFWPGSWSLPGGLGEGNETPVEAAKREFKEETGYDLHDPHLITTGTFRKPNGQHGKRYVFAETYDGVRQINCYEGVKMEFVPIDDLLSLDIIPQEKEVLKKLIESDKLTSLPQQ